MLEHARQEHALAAHVACKTAVETFVKGCVKFLAWEDRSCEQLIPELLNFRREVVRRLRVDESAVKVPSLVLLNWTTPCSFRDHRQNEHTNLLAWALHDNPMLG